MHKHACVVVVAWLSASVLASCQGRSEDATAAPVATNQQLTGATVTRARTEAERGANADVMRFADELPLAPTPAILVTTIAHVRKSPGGDAILILNEGTEVTELARARDHYLVQFLDPSDRSRRLTGWIYKDALDGFTPPGEVASAASRAACAKGDVRVQSDRVFCARPCKSDGDCEGASVCDGEARVVSAIASARARYCVSQSTPW
jgi:hypothetical protein